MKERIRYWLGLGLVLAAYLAVSILTFGCPFRFVFGLSCPGCGMSRSFFALLRGDVAAAVSYHPLIIAVPALFYAIYRCESKNDRIGKVLLTVLIFLFFFVWILRIFQEDPVVAFDFKDSLIFRSSRWISS